MSQNPAIGTLLLHVVGPMQAWETQSKHTERDTGLEPSKSGIVGLLAAAMGIPRSGDITSIAALKMGVRIDREGIKLPDYQTAANVLEVSGGLSDLVSTRYYLADAAFLVGLEGDLPMLQTIHAALRNPRWPLFLGRKAFVPGEPVWLEDGLKPGLSLAEALDPKIHPWQPRPGQIIPDRLRLVLEDSTGSDVRPDQPISFQSNARRFAPRRVKTGWLTPDWTGLENLSGLQPKET